MAFVDAPIGHNLPNARYPAYPILRRYFSEDAICFLDDTWRAGERAILEKMGRRVRLRPRIF